MNSPEFLTYQTNMKKALQWISDLEEELNIQGDNIPNDLNAVKDKFQNHEV